MLRKSIRRVREVGGGGSNKSSRDSSPAKKSGGSLKVVEQSVRFQNCNGNSHEVKVQHRTKKTHQAHRGVTVHDEGTKKKKFDYIVHSESNTKVKTFFERSITVRFMRVKV